MYSSLVPLLLLFLASLDALCSASGNTCIRLLTNELANKTSSEVTTTCSNSNLRAVRNATACFPLHSSGDMDEYISWYSRVTETIKVLSNLDSNSSSSSHLYFAVTSLLADSQRIYNVNSLPIGDSKTMVSALLAFVNYASWRRVAITTHLTNQFYLEPMEQFYQNFTSAFEIHMSQILGGEKAIEHSLKRIKKMKYRVIIASLPEDTLRALLFKRISLGMTWPSYIWVIVNSDESKLYENNPCLEQVILFQYLTRKLPLHRDTKVPVIYDSLIDLTNNSNISTQCYNHAKHSYGISIDTRKEERLKHIANYTPADGLSSVNLPFIPGDSFLQSLFTFYIINSITAFLVLLLLTGMLVLYIWFRNEPDIKATGVSLNILTFLGCYLLWFYLILLNINGLPNDYPETLSFANHVCKFQLWFNGLSIPTALILSVLLVKLA